MSHPYRISLVFLIVLTSFGLKSQDLVFSQFYNAPLLLNPAFTGVTQYPTFTLNYRNQWPSLDNAYISYAGSYNQYFARARSGLGMQITSDQEADGILANNSVGLYYSYTLEFSNDNYLKIGLSSTIGQSRIDWSRLVFGDQIDPTDGANSTINSQEVAPNSLATQYFDISSGFLFYNKRFYVGFGLFHLNNPSIGYRLNGPSDNGIPLRISAHAGYQIDLWDTKSKYPSFIQPTVLVTNQAQFTQVNVGVGAQLGRALAGVFYRHTVNNPDAAIAYMGYKLDAVELTYSYDFTVSQLAGRSGGSHELGVVFDLEVVLPPKSKLNDCLKLFR